MVWVSVAYIYLILFLTKTGDVLVFSNTFNTDVEKTCLDILDELLIKISKL